MPNYTTMSILFHDTIAVGTFAHASTIPPITDEEEDRLLREHNNPSPVLPFPNVDDNPEGVAEVDKNQRFEVGSPSSGSKRKTPSSSVNDCNNLNLKMAKLNHLIFETKMYNYWTQLDSKKVEKIGQEIELMKAGPQQAAIDPFDIPVAISILESDFPNISDEVYTQVVISFHNEQWRKTWLSMSEKRRQWYVDNIHKFIN